MQKIESRLFDLYSGVLMGWNKKMREKERELQKKPGEKNNGNNNNN